MSLSNLHKLEVLIVDDYEMIRTALRNALINLGFKNITEADNGSVAMKLIQNNLSLDIKFDIIFSDWNMPEVDGFELLKFCKNHEALKAIPFVMVTAESDSAAILSAVKAGVDDYVVKPFAPASIQSKLVRLLSAKK